MKTFTKTALTVITASILATSAFASSDDSAYESFQSSKAGVAALSNTLESLGATVDDSVNLSGAYTYAQKEAVYDAKHTELQNQFNVLHAQSAE